ncbi:MULTISPECIES: DUF378 domain-containing protein [unclassified Roseateles]|uniref:DUF378 domain-containing protein n=1 Tax=unclassified Roseateles TaxID=2626991 RepID=UPI0009EAD7DF|nr:MULTISPECIES: DUF378 domain-containing protein [unclassified Roseateles]
MAISHSSQRDMTSDRSVSTTTSSLNAVDWIALLLMIIGGINWGLVGLFQFDLVATLFGTMTPVSRIVYGLVGLAALYGIVIVIKWSRRT